MPSKEELETEVAVLRLQVAGRPAKRGCTGFCSHGMAYHGGSVCYGDQNGNYASACACPEHPDDLAIPDKWVE